MNKLIRKRLKAALSATLAVSMAVNVVSFSSSAYSGEIGNSVNWSPVQVIEDTKVNDGGVSSTTKITVRTGSNAKWDEIIKREEVNEYKEREDGQTIESMKSEITMVEASSSNAEYSYEEGESKLTELNQDYPELTVTLKEGERSVAKAEVPDAIVIGTKLDSIKNVAEYEWTEIIENPRTVTASMSNATKTVLGNDSSQMIMNPIVPEFYRGRKQVFKVSNYGYNEDGDYVDRFASYIDAERPEGYNFQYTGYGDESYYMAGYKSQSDGNVVDAFEVCNFELTDKVDLNQQKVYTYCVDADTKTQKGFWYKLENLEDAGYYSPEVAPKIRAVVNNGYWGTIGHGNDGKIEHNDTVTGSLARLKKLLKNSGNTGLTNDEIDGMTEGEALLATQLSIWKYGKHEEKGTQLDLFDSYDVYDRAVSELAKKRINATVEFLTSLEEKTTEENSTPIINEDKFIDELKLTVKDRNSDGSYTVDVSFSLKVEPDTDRDDLTVVLRKGSEEIASEKLTGNNPLPHEDGFYTLSDLTINEGDVEFELLLEGSQIIKRGVYIYKSEVRDNYLNQRTGQIEDGVTSQTFVSIAEGENLVDVEMDVVFNFEVEEGNKVTEHFWRFEEFDEGETEESSSSEEHSSTEESSSKEESSSEEESTSQETTTRVYDDDDDNEPETTRRTTAAPTTTVPETTVPETTVLPTSPIVIYRGVEIPQEILDAYPDKTLDELYDMGVLGAFFENVPTGLLPATNDLSVIWTAMSVLSAIGLAGVSVIGKRREDDEE